MAHKKLTSEDRFFIEKCLDDNITLRSIAKALNVAPSTISREIKRNRDPDFNGLYSCRRAATLANLRRQRHPTRHPFEGLTQQVLDYIHLRLDTHTSPEAISGELRVNFGIYVGKDVIYRYLYHDKQRGGTLHKNLPHSGKPYKRTGENAKRSTIVGRVSIHQRPAEADLKQTPGHFEADTIFGRDQKSFLLTLSDKATKTSIVRKLPDKRAETVVAAFKEIVSSTLYTFLTITSDNVTEFAGHQEIAKITGADFYFADPYSSWQRGLNEHTNGLIRRFYKKGTDFNLFDDKDIAKVEHILNTRGRKSLGYKSPNQVFLETLRTA